MKRHSLDSIIYDIIEKNIDSLEYEEFISCYSMKRNRICIQIYKRNLSDLLISVYVTDNVSYKEYKLSEQMSSKVRRIFSEFEDKNDTKLDNDLETVKELLDTFNEDTELQESENQLP